MKNLTQFILVIFTMIFTASAHALLIGENIQGGITNIGWSQTQTVTDPGVEFTLFGDGGANINADLSDTNLSLIYNSENTTSIGIDFNWEFTLLNPDLIFTSATEFADNYVNGSIFNGISNGGKTISFTIFDQDGLTNSTYTASYALGVMDTTVSVPEPSTIILMGLGMLGFSYRRRKLTN